MLNNPSPLNSNIPGTKMKDQIDILVALQQITIESSVIKTHLAAISKKLEILNDRRNETDQRIIDETELIEESRKTYRSYESDIKQNQIMIKRSQERLFSIKNNREYQALLKEIEELKRTNSSIEDQMIECLNLIDAAEKRLSSLHKDLNDISEDLNTEQKTVSLETKSANKRIEELEAERIDISCKIEPDTLKLFQKIQAKESRGIAVVPVQDAVCRGCYVNIPPQMYNELQRCDSLRMCPNCQRIIYWKQA